MSSSGNCASCGEALAPEMGGICPRCFARDLDVEPQAKPQKPPLLPEEAVGAEAFGRYLKVRKVGSGGMGEVWRAWDTSMERWVALKFLRGDARDLPRFQREARTAGALAHPHIASVYDSGEIDGCPYIALQFLEGRTLAEIPPRDRGWVVRILRDVALAIHYAHQRGVVHRDLKPGNLMVEEPGGHVYVMDFGLARPLEVESSLSMTGSVMGTPFYMSPEQSRGEATDARTDVYSLGATLYELAVRRPPFMGRNLPELLARIQREDPIPPTRLDPRIDRDLETIILKCLEKDPARRYSSAKALAEDLERLLEGQPVVARPASRLYRARKFAGRHRTALGLSFALLLVGGYSLWGGLWPGSLTIDSSPRGAAIRVDGRDTGRRTPDRVPLWPPGSHVIDLAREGYERASVDLVVRAGEGLHRSVELTRVSGYLTIVSTPPGAEVLLSSKGTSRTLGRTPLQRLELPRGMHRILLRKEGYEEWTELAELRADAETRLEHPLAPELGEVDLTGNVEGISVTLESLGRPEEPVRYLPVPSFGSRVPTGRYRLTFEKENHHSRVREVRVSKEGKTGVHATLAPMYSWSRSMPFPISQLRTFRQGKMALVDFNGDGILDVLLVHETGILALSGRDGSTLWESVESVTYDIPFKLADLDGDGIPDVVLLGPSIVTALSGRDGRRIWKYQSADTNLAGNNSLGPFLRDLNGDGIPDCLTGWKEGGLFAISGKDGSLLWNLKWYSDYSYSNDLVAFTSSPDGSCRISLVRQGKLQVLSGQDGSLIQEFKVAEAGPLPLFVPGDLNGDGIDDVVTLGSKSVAYSGADGTTLWALPQRDWSLHLQHPPVDIDGDGVPDFFLRNSKVLAVSGARGAILWEAAPGTLLFLSQECSDLDGDGLPDLILASNGAVTVLSGRNGQVLWDYKSGTNQLGHVVLGDLSGAGGVDCLFATKDGVCTALSGRTGSVLWKSRIPGEFNNTSPILGDLKGEGFLSGVVWGNGGVTVLDTRAPSLEWEVRLDQQITGPLRTADVDGDGVPDCVLSCASSRALRVLSGIDGSTLWTFEPESILPQPFPQPFVVGPANLDGDDVPDWILTDTDRAVLGISGKSHQVVLRVAGGYCPPAVGDLNGDGIDDVVVSSKLGVAARSGKTGEELWKVADLQTTTAPPLLADLDGDGIPDCIVRTGGLRVLSGKDGSLLWTARVNGANCFPHPIVADFSGEGRLDILSERQPQAIRGSDGTPLWLEKKHSTGGMVVIGDCDGDGIADVLSATSAKDRSGTAVLRLAVLSGRDGSLVYDFAAPKIVPFLTGPPTEEPFQSHEHSELMYRGWRVSGLVPRHLGPVAVAVAGSNVVWFDRWKGQVLGYVQGSPPLTAADATPASGEDPYLFVGDGRRIRKLRLTTRAPSAYLDSRTASHYLEGLPEVLNAVRAELLRAPDGRGVPALCERLLKAEQRPDIQRLLAAIGDRYRSAPTLK